MNKKIILEKLALIQEIEDQFKAEKPVRSNLNFIDALNKDRLFCDGEPLQAIFSTFANQVKSKQNSKKEFSPQLKETAKKLNLLKKEIEDYFSDFAFIYFTDLDIESANNLANRLKSPLASEIYGKTTNNRLYFSFLAKSEEIEVFIDFLLDGFVEIDSFQGKTVERFKIDKNVSFDKIKDFFNSKEHYHIPKIKKNKRESLDNLFFGFNDLQKQKENVETLLDHVNNSFSFNIASKFNIWRHALYFSNYTNNPANFTDIEKEINNLYKKTIDNLNHYWLNFKEKNLSQQDKEYFQSEIESFENSMFNLLVEEKKSNLSKASIFLSAHNEFLENYKSLEQTKKDFLREFDFYILPQNNNKYISAMAKHNNIPMYTIKKGKKEFFVFVVDKKYSISNLIDNILIKKSDLSALKLVNDTEQNLF